MLLIYSGKIEKKRGNYDEAQRCYEKSLDIIVKIYGDNHPKAALFFHDLGVIYRKKQLYEKSWEAYMKAKELNELNFGPDSGAAAMNLNGLVSCEILQQADYFRVCS